MKASGLCFLFCRWTRFQAPGLEVLVLFENYFRWRFKSHQFDVVIKSIQRLKDRKLDQLTVIDKFYLIFEVAKNVSEYRCKGNKTSEVHLCQSLRSREKDMEQSQLPLSMFWFQELCATLTEFYLKVYSYDRLEAMIEKIDRNVKKRIRSRSDDTFDHHFAFRISEMVRNSRQKSCLSSLKCTKKSKSIFISFLEETDKAASKVDPKFFKKVSDVLQIPESEQSFLPSDSVSRQDMTVDYIKRVLKILTEPKELQKTDLLIICLTGHGNSG